MKMKKLLTTFTIILVVLFAGCKKDDYVEVIGVCPLVISTDPVNGAVSVPYNKIITATFNEKMDQASITQSSFMLLQGTSLTPGTVSYIDSDSTASFVPTTPLSPFTTYKGIIKNTVKDKRSNVLQADYVWTFTTMPFVTLIPTPLLGGTISGGGAYAVGATVTVTATPSVGYVFVNWTENGTQVSPVIKDKLGNSLIDNSKNETVVSTSSSYTFAMPARNRTLMANFAVIVLGNFYINLFSNPPAGGATSGGGTFIENSIHTVSASPNTGYTFVNWTEGGIIVSTSATYQLAPLIANRSLVANFTPIPYTVQVSSLPILGGTTSGGGTYNYGTSVTVNAVPNAGFAFSNWTEGVTVVSTNVNYQFTITGNRTLVANYTAIPYTVAVSTNPSTLSNQPTGGGTFNYGTSVTVIAGVNSGYTFTNWTEGLTVVSTNANYQFTITSNRTLVANYTAIQYTVAVSTNPSALLNRPTGSGTFNSGASVTVTAAANIGYTFTNWTEGVTVVSTNANYQFIITGNRILVANYTAGVSSYTVAVSTNPSTLSNQPTGGGTYNSGASVTVTAVANTGYTFTNWTEGINIVSSNASYTFNITSNRTLVANYTAGIVVPPLFSSRFGIFGGTAGMTNQGTLTLIVGGDIGTIATGTSAITGFHDSNGDIYTETGSNIGGVSGLILSCTNSTTGPTSAGVNAANCSAATVGLNAIQAAYDALAGMPVSGVLLPANLSGLTVAPGVYKAPAGSFMIQDGLPGPAGDLTLSGTATDVWVFQMSTSLTVGGPGAAFPRSVKLTGGALAKNVYWQVGSAATINAGGGGTMVGTIISMAGVAISTSGNVQIVTLNGRALSLVASVTLVNTVINVPQ
jgi:general stress protein CsbA